MRFRGGGVGHKSTHEATRCAYEDRDVMDTADYESGDSDDEEAMFEDQTSDEGENNQSASGGSDSESENESDNSDMDADVDPSDEYEVEGFADF